MKPPAIALAASGLLVGAALAAAWGGGWIGGAATGDRRAERTELVDGIEAALAAPMPERVAPLTIDYPSEGTVFPPEIVAPTFLWHDDTPGVDAWAVEVAFADGGPALRLATAGPPPPRGAIDPRCIAPTNRLHEPTPYQASARSFRPAPAAWETIKRRSTGAPAVVSFLGVRAAGRTVLSRGSVTIETSPDPVGAPIFYRDVPLMPSKGEEGVIKPLDQSALPLIAWRLKDISRDDSRVLLSDMPTCANCHSFPDDGRTLAMDLDGPDGDKGAYAIASIAKTTVIGDAQVMTWNAFEGRSKDHYTLGFLARISPDGRRVVATVNEALYVRNYTDYQILQTFYPTRGILAVFSRDTGRIEALAGADDPAWVHCDAVWTPDGKQIVFARARATDPYDRDRPVATYAGDPNETPIQYDLYRMPLNDGKGGMPVPIQGASANGASNSFPKVSPDGKWVVFVKSRNGQLLRPDGTLWIVPLAGGEARKMRCNTPLMNSWHSFSPNGRWMVFSSKQNRPYTQMFLTHVDANGNDTPPVLIESATADNRAVNIPEFVNVPYEEFERITVPAVEYHQFFKRGNELAREGRLDDAIGQYERALEEEDAAGWRLNEWRIHDSMSKTLLKMGRTAEALEHIRESLRIYPRNGEMQGNLGVLLFEAGDLAGARKHLDLAVRYGPDRAQAWYNRGALRMTLGDSTGAAGDYARALRLDPGYAAAYRGRGMARWTDGDLAGARADLDAALRLDPRDATSLFFRGRVRAAAGDAAGAREDLDRAARVVPPGSPQRAEIDALRREMR